MVWYILTDTRGTALISFWTVFITAKITVTALIALRINMETHFLNSTISNLGDGGAIHYWFRAIGWALLSIGDEGATALKPGATWCSGARERAAASISPTNETWDYYQNHTSVTLTTFNKMLIVFTYIYVKFNWWWPKMYQISLDLYWIQLDLI